MTKTIIRTHADGSPALWLEAYSPDGPFDLCDDNLCSPTNWEELEADIAAWDEAVGNRIEMLEA